MGLVNKYSFISMRNNQVTDEQICIGLFYMNETGVEFRFSEKKIEFTKTLNPDAHRLLVFYVDQMKRAVLLKSLTMQEVINEAHRQNGIIYISEPKIINIQEPLNLINDNSSFIGRFFEKNVDTLPIFNKNESVGINIHTKKIG